MGFTWILSRGMNVAWPARWLRIYYMRVFSTLASQEIRIAYLDTVDGGFFLVYDDRIHVSTKNDRDCQLVLPLGRFAQINNTTAYAYEEDQL